MSEENIKTKVLEALGMSKEADVEALKTQVVDIDSKLEQMKLDNAEALKSMKEELTSAFTDALKEAFADKAQKKDDEEEEQEEVKPSDEEQNEEQSSEEEEEEEEKKKKADKSTKIETHGKSKQKPNHNADNGADKSKTENTYEYLGRNPDGTRK